jgi:hypothetical protein
LGKFVVSNTTNYQVIRGVDNGEITETVSRWEWWQIYIHYWTFWIRT